jgi:alpha-mannosidase
MSYTAKPQLKRKIQMKKIISVGIALVLAVCARAVLIEEPVPADKITVTASSSYGPEQNPRHLVDGSGMSGDRHDDHGTAATMWHTVENVTNAWVRFDFAQPVTLDSVRIWNHNQAGLRNRGFRKARLVTSAGTSQVIELKRGTGLPERFVLASKTPVSSITIIADSNHGGNAYGLSAVQFMTAREMAENDVPFPTGIEVQPQAFYGHRKDGKPGRAVRLNFTGAKLYGNVTVEAMGETTRFQNLQGAGDVTVLLPAGASATNACEAKFTLRRGDRSLTQTASIPAKRQWTVYIYPHSHVDIGYTNNQKNVEEIHKRNLLYGIELAKKTANWPEGSRYVWDPEVIWPVERYLHHATPAQQAEVRDAIRKGWLCLDAGYANANTSAAADEELDEFFGPAKRIAKWSGVPIDSLVQVDVPGMSWGIVPAAERAGVRYVLLLRNGGDRMGHARDLDHRPFWWVGPDGQSKVLCLQPADYAICARIKGGPFIRQMEGQLDPNKWIPFVKTDDPRANFIDGHLWPTLERLEKSDFYPYDIFTMSWAVCDNMPIDADLPEAVRSWNEEYAFPHLIIAGGHQIMSVYEKKYGHQFPVRRGDFTEYWTDGLGSAAKQTGMNRKSAERLIQADTLWTMLRRPQPAPRAEFNEAWRYVLLGMEHTWCYSNPRQEPMNGDILREKFRYFQEGEDRGKALIAQALAPVTATNGNTIAVFNTLNWPRTGLVTLPAGVTGIAGEPTQKLSSGETVFLAKDVPAFGVRHYRIGTDSVAVDGCKATDLTLENGLVTVALDPQTGDIVSLKDKAGNEYVNGFANTYRYLRGGNTPAQATEPSDVTISVKENGPLVASLLVESKAEGCRSLTREVRLIAGEPYVEVINIVDKLPVQSKEGVHFGFAFNVPEPRTRIDIPWGVAEVEKDQFPEGNRNWIAFQRWLDISGKDRGVTWCSLDAPLFEHGTMTANIQGPSFNPNAWLARLEPSATVYSWAMNNHWYTNFPLSQGGPVTFRYRILPHNNGYDVVAANRFGVEQAQPLIATPVKEKINLAPLVTVDNPRIVVSSVKSEANDVVVTLRSISNRPETVTLGNKVVKILPAGVVNVRLEAR